MQTPTTPPRDGWRGGERSSRMEEGCLVRSHTQGPETPGGKTTAAEVPPMPWKTKEAQRTGKGSSVIIQAIITTGMQDKFSIIPEDFNDN